MRDRPIQQIGSHIDELAERGVYRGLLESATQLILSRHRSEVDMAPELTAISFLNALEKHYVLTERDSGQEIIGHTTAKLIEDFLGNLHRTVASNQWGPHAVDPCETAVRDFVRVVSQKNAERTIGAIQFASSLLRFGTSAPR